MDLQPDSDAAAQADVDAFSAMAQAYADAGVVFTSATKKQATLYHFFVNDRRRMMIRRLSDPNAKAARLPAERVGRIASEVRGRGGRAAIADFPKMSRARQAALIQAPTLAISPDRQNIVALTSPQFSVELLGDYIDDFRADRSGSSPRRYKPAVIAAVIEVIGTGEMSENQFHFDAIVDRALAWLRSHGDDVGEPQIAQGFYSLSNEPLWLLAFHDPSEPIRHINEATPAAIRQRVKFALLRPPFWDALQDADHRRVLLERIEKRWGSPEAITMQIDEELLALAVQKTLRPHLIDEGALNDPKREAYHHQEVIPGAQPHLTREALEADPVTHVGEAIKSCKNLLSSFERMWALTFLKTADPDELRTHTVDLLYGEGEIDQRAKRFHEWAIPQDTDEGKSGFHITAISYLLAVHSPGKVAFCKPKIYKAATRAMLGNDAIEGDKYKRLAHATELYGVMLKSLQGRHAMPFTDLMHVHLSAYLMCNEFHGKPTWDQLKTDDKPPNPDPGPRVMTSHALNTILYGPPGTGKTYESIQRAVLICDGSLPTDAKAINHRFNELRDDGRIGMVTFHQSFGYEDFVEGIRPVLVDDSDIDSAEADGVDDGQVRYHCHDGVFKRLCLLAGSHTRASKPIDVDLASTRFWKMSLGNVNNPETASIFDDCVEQGVVMLGWGGEPDYAGCDTREAVRERAQQNSNERQRTPAAVNFMHRFKNELKAGDLIVVPDGNHKFRAIGKITGEYEHSPDTFYHHKRAVEWILVCDDSLPVEKIYRKVFSQQTLYGLRPKLLKIEAIAGLLGSDEAVGPQPHVLIIDEINRANVSKVFGELITLLEPDKRLGGENELSVSLAYSGKPFGVPSNLYVLGTMNTADRSIALLDVALRRRFRFEELMPDSEVIQEIVGDDGTVDGIDVGALLDAINSRVELLYDRDHQLGHSFFLKVGTLDDLKQVFLDSVIPMLQEYFYGDWAKVCIALGCPFDPETGKTRPGNSSPIIQPVRLSAEKLAGAGDDFEDKVRCNVSPKFLAAEGSALQPFFEGVLSPKSAE